jgi:hemerythrin HHE cation binding domain-containing protein
MQTKTARRKTAARAAATRATRRRATSKPPSTLGSVATAARGVVAGAVAAVSQRLPWASGEPDAITLLEIDHRRLENLLEQGEETTERAIKGRTELLNTLTAELNAHELIEEKLLYPALKEHPQAKDIVLEGYQEHHVADVIVRELHQVGKGDERWGAKFKVLKENIEHHIKEEEGEMFRTARAVLSREQLQNLGARMTTMKAKALRT